MIPKVIPPLTGLTVLVTRPAAQNPVLCATIERLGGEAISLPTIAIEPLQAIAAPASDLVIFVSVNAVEHGAKLLPTPCTAKIAAIGRATAAALIAAGLPPQIVPATGFDSETLLQHPALAQESIHRVLIVRGVGGRELMRETFLARGVEVETLEVYRRAMPHIDAARLHAIETMWSSPGIDFVTLTSVETLQNLLKLLSDGGRALLANTGLVVASGRIAAAARAAGLVGEIVLAAGADDDAMLGALARRHARART